MEITVINKNHIRVYSRGNLVLFSYGVVAAVLNMKDEAWVLPRLSKTSMKHVNDMLKGREYKELTKEMINKL